TARIAVAAHAAHVTERTTDISLDLVQVLNGVTNTTGAAAAIAYLASSVPSYRTAEDDADQTFTPVTFTDSASNAYSAEALVHDVTDYDLAEGLWLTPQAESNHANSQNANNAVDEVSTYHLSVVLPTLDPVRQQDDVWLF